MVDAERIAQEVYDEVEANKPSYFGNKKTIKHKSLKDVSTVEVQKFSSM
jgi:hypothetical protein